MDIGSEKYLFRTFRSSSKTKGKNISDKQIVLNKFPKTKCERICLCQIALYDNEDKFIMTIHAVTRRKAWMYARIIVNSLGTDDDERPYNYP